MRSPKEKAEEIYNNFLDKAPALEPAIKSKQAAFLFADKQAYFHTGENRLYWIAVRSQIQKL